MGIERGLVLADLGEVGIDLDKGRRVLREAADLARTEIALTPATASWIRRLCMRKPVPSTPLGTGIVIRLPERLLVRASTEVTSRSLRTGVVAEMIAWEMAAALSGRTMGEWALRELSLRTGRQL